MDGGNNEECLRTDDVPMSARVMVDGDEEGERVDEMGWSGSGYGAEGAAQGRRASVGEDENGGGDVGSGDGKLGRLVDGERGGRKERDEDGKEKREG